MVYADTINNRMNIDKVFNVPFFSPTEYMLIRSWWTLRKMIPPELDMIPEESTFDLDVEGKPVASLTVILTNTGTAWLDNFITDPESDYSMRDRKSTRLNSS